MSIEDKDIFHEPTDEDIIREEEARAEVEPKDQMRFELKEYLGDCKTVEEARERDFVSIEECFDYNSDWGKALTTIDKDKFDKQKKSFVDSAKEKYERFKEIEVKLKEIK